MQNELVRRQRAEIDVSHKATLSDSGFDGNTYHYQFSGQVVCGETPCDNATVALSLHASAETVVEDEVTTDANGNNVFNVELTERLNAPIDWTLDAWKSAQNAQVQGRQILTDQQSITIERQLALL